MRAERPIFFISVHLLCDCHLRRPVRAARALAQFAPPPRPTCSPVKFPVWLTGSQLHARLSRCCGCESSG